MCFGRAAQALMLDQLLKNTHKTQNFGPISGRGIFASANEGMRRAASVTHMNGRENQLSETDAPPTRKICQIDDHIMIDSFQPKHNLKPAHLNKKQLKSQPFLNLIIRNEAPCSFKL
ncbi:hypothetical protein ILYODFUR_001256 [Ilyodon furcidens]|uniref:Uncharacterized protein n=1 Tax=Ilyodon furcidens TaxID=33524 RepID=A0ABV0UZ91_9TELE